MFVKLIQGLRSQEEEATHITHLACATTSESTPKFSEQSAERGPGQYASPDAKDEVLGKSIAYLMTVVESTESVVTIQGFLHFRSGDIHQTLCTYRA